MFYPNKKVIAKMNKIGFELSGDMSWHFHCGAWTLPFQIGIKFNIPLLILSGHHFLIKEVVVDRDWDRYPETLLLHHPGLKWSVFLVLPWHALNSLNWASASRKGVRQCCLSLLVAIPAKEDQLERQVICINRQNLIMKQIICKFLSNQQILKSTKVKYQFRTIIGNNSYY